MSRLVPLSLDDYPAEDDLPMAETPFHAQVITLFHQAVEDFFAGRADVFIASDINWYWEEGNLDAVVAPDTLVAVGVPPKPLEDRRCYFQWLEGGKVPAVVFEVASKSTWRADLAAKKERYQSLGVPEYVIFDPLARYLRTRPLRLYRLRRGEYCLARPRGGVLASRLGFQLRAEGQHLRMIDGRTGEPILTRREAVDRQRMLTEAERQRAEAERQRAEVERQRAEDAQRRELDALRRAAAAEGNRAAAEAGRADALQEAVDALRRLTAERQRADALAAELERLRGQPGQQTP